MLKIHLIAVDDSSSRVIRILHSLEESADETPIMLKATLYGMGKKEILNFKGQIPSKMETRFPATIPMLAKYLKNDPGTGILYILDKSLKNILPDKALDGKTIRTENFTNTDKKQIQEWLRTADQIRERYRELTEKEILQCVESMESRSGFKNDVRSMTDRRCADALRELLQWRCVNNTPPYTL